MGSSLSKLYRTTYRQVVFTLCSILLIPPIIYAGNTTQLSTTVQWDNPKVEQQMLTDRYLELLVTVPENVSYSDQDTRSPLNLCLVIDRSGSMGSEGKLEMVKKAAKEMLGGLQPGDRFSLITYSDSVEIHFSSMPASRRASIYHLIDSLEPGGNTYLSGGLEAGYEEIKLHFDPTAINRVFLLSDGLANRGITSSFQLAEIAEQHAREGISLSTCGVGYQFNEDLMAELSERGRGMYYYVEEPAQLADIFNQELRNLRYLAAKDVELHLQLAPGVEMTEIFANSYQTHGPNITIQAGDLAAGELRRIQLHVQFPAFAPGIHEVGTLFTTYRIPGSGKLFSKQQKLSVVSGKYGDNIDRFSDPGVMERSAVFHADRARKDAATAISRGDIREAKKQLNSAMEQLSTSPVQGKRIQKEMEQTKKFSNSLHNSHNSADRARIEKRIKHKSYVIEGC
ncbi:vWA domain-containing protein [Desulfogranum japonicum]|uniref:vWA domain-containing protein n=1 Tax=Desulfogranum japonicum TaxID=231447 RepID=UPI0004253C18|nr:VWA domain-containing protein [Desulfogranum japonicum]